MSLNRYAQRRDTNEPELLKIVSQFGAEWDDNGPLDGWCGWRERWVPVEIKHGKNKYTRAQILFIAMCKQRGLPVWTWRNEMDVYESLGARRTA